ncbi:MAG TPA: aminotransferase class I/II-fold pyridoxal phosphate-dependent enzyme [Pirellulaceae bacterium]|nr:aminotransferase class I/II-fold pyridoxal phosphate-dependent enzyme [Pirellulaceae bacterium]
MNTATITAPKYRIAQRISRLGTETAFAVSAEAAALAKTGLRVYPFHLGDLDMKTPQNVIDAAFAAANAGKTGYCPNAGIPALREALAEDISRSHRVPYTSDHVVIQPGGKPTIGKFIMALMESGEEVLYPNPGYPIYESQIEFHGGRAIPYGFREGAENFEIDLQQIEDSITDRTRILVYNNLHNPTGAESSLDEMHAIAELALRHDLIVLSDEAYFDIRYQGISTSIASLPDMAARTVILYTFSKKFAMTGWRLGATIAPVEIASVIAKLNVNDESCPNHFIQYGAIAGLRESQHQVQQMLETLRQRRDLAVQLLNSIDGVQCYCPQATFYLYPNVTELMRRKGFTDYEAFRRQVLRDTGVSFCTRLHFGRAIPGESLRYIRFAYSGIPSADIEEGLGKLIDWSR